MRVIQAEDLYQLQTVNDPQISPDGQQVLYVQQRVDRKTEKKFTNLWLVPGDGDAAAVHLRRSARFDAALVARRQADRVPLHAQGRETGADLPDPRGWGRGEAAHRTARQRQCHLLVARRHTPAH
ncbi:MAG: hypothetical protein R2873_22530 [Caldilineaceae bacterium]